MSYSKLTIHDAAVELLSRRKARTGKVAPQVVEAEVFIPAQPATEQLTKPQRIVEVVAVQIYHHATGQRMLQVEYRPLINNHTDLDTRVLEINPAKFVAWLNACVAEGIMKACNRTEQLTGMVLDMAVVRVKLPDAYAEKFGNWNICGEHGPIELTRTAIEPEAWADASAKVIESEYEILEPSPNDKIWLRDRKEDAWVGVYDTRELALESAKRDYIQKQPAQPVDAGETDDKLREICSVCNLPRYMHSKGMGHCPSQQRYTFTANAEGMTTAQIIDLIRTGYIPPDHLEQGGELVKAVNEIRSTTVAALLKMLEEAAADAKRQSFGENHKANRRYLQGKEAAYLTVCRELKKL